MIALFVCVFRSAEFVTKDNFLKLDMETHTSPLDGLHCTGSETYLDQCNQHTWRRIGSCSIVDAAGVSCVSNGESNFDIVSITAIL